VNQQRFRRPNGGLLVLAESVLVTIVRHRQIDHDSKEAGGMLLGRLITGSEDIIIDRVTEPNAEDVRGRFKFIRSRGLAQKIVDQAWNESQNTTHYLGEWHTHPEDDPAPSGQDLINWNDISKKSEHEFDSLFFVISGRMKLRAWEISRADSHILELTEIDAFET
jgi:integrative and conjugative element protein (TIGR02256 family)